MQSYLHYCITETLLLVTFQFVTRLCNRGEERRLKQFAIFSSVALAFGAKESTLANNIFTLVNLGVVVFVVTAGSFKGISF